VSLKYGNDFVLSTFTVKNVQRNKVHVPLHIHDNSGIPIHEKVGMLYEWRELSPARYPNASKVDDE